MSRGHILHKMDDKEMPLPWFNGKARRVVEIIVVAAILVLAAFSIYMVIYTLFFY